MQQDKLRDFLKFFRFHLPWFVLSAGFFAVIILSGIFFSSRLADFRDSRSNVADQDIALSIPQEQLPAEVIVDNTVDIPDAPAAPSPVVAPTSPNYPSSSPSVSSTPSPVPAPIATIQPTAVPAPAVSPSPTDISQSPINKPIVGSDSKSAETYEVKQGDTLWDISLNKYGTGYDYSRISRENKLANPSRLTIGQKLVLPPNTEPGKIASGVSIDKGDAAVTTNSDKYTIVSGDSLWKIAETQLGDPYRWTEIYQLNKAVIGSNPDLIYPDVALDMPGSRSNSTSMTPSSSSSVSTSDWTSSLLQ